VIIDAATSNPWHLADLIIASQVHALGSQVQPEPVVPGSLDNVDWFDPKPWFHPELGIRATWHPTGSSYFYKPRTYDQYQLEVSK